MMIGLLLITDDTLICMLIEKLTHIRKVHYDESIPTFHGIHFFNLVSQMLLEFPDNAIQTYLVNRTVSNSSE